MKKIFTFGIMAFLMILNSCAKPEIKNETFPPTSEITGLWTLTKITGGFAGVNESFAGTIMYNFDTTNNLVTVNNNYVGTLLTYTGLLTGSYPFLLSGTNDININSQNAKYTITDNTLYIDENVSADGFGYTFQRRWPECGQQCVSLGQVFVDSATVPTTAIVNNQIQISINFSVNNGCGAFENFTETNVGKIKILTVNAKFTGCICTLSIVKIQTNYSFTPTATGLQIIKIAQPDGTFLTYNINITN